MKIIRFNTPIITGTETIKDPYTHGLFCAEGFYQNKEYELKQCTYKKYNNMDFCKFHINNQKLYENNDNKCCAESKQKKPGIHLYGEKKKLLDKINYLNFTSNDSQDRITVTLHHDIEDKFIVPLNATIETKIRWLEGYLDGDGTVIKLNGIKNIQFGSIEFEFIKNIFYMLQTLGVNCTKIAIAHKEQIQMMPDHNGGMKEYLCKTFYRTTIDSTGLIHLQTLGFSPNRLDISDCRPPHHKTNQYVKIKSVEDNNEYDDTYCFNEPLKHTGIFNGIITGNCSEIALYSDKNETAVCNLASIGLPTFIKYSDDRKPYFDFKELHRVTQVITRNLNKVIDRTFYPIPETRTSNLRHRPLGIGVQGLANTYVLMRMPFESPDASTLNRKIFATIYHAALTASVAISRRRYEYREELNNSTVVATNERKEYLIKYLNMIPEEETLKGQYSGAYSSFIGSPASQGKLQYDLWDVKEPETVDGFLDWVSLKEEIAQYGLRNSTLLAPMPTATTSQILGFNESFEAFTSNIYQRQTLAGEFTIINKHLIQDLLNLGMWNNEMKDKILSGSGSVQNIKDIPENVRLLYKTVWEIKQKIVIDQSADRAPYICQTQSLNIHLEDPDFAKMTNVHFYGWKKGLKTGMYYLRSRNKAKITAFTLENNKYALGGTSAASSSNISSVSSVSGVSSQPSEEEVLACRRDNPEGCVMCSG